LRRRLSGSVRVRYAPSRERIEEILSAYFKRLSLKFDLKLGVLFGSYAKGNYSWGSDVDVFVVASGLPIDQSERFSALLDLDAPVELQPFGYTPQEFRKMLMRGHPLVNRVLREGQILYATPDYRSLVETYRSKKSRPTGET